jgi:CheY-like chemotaxis protein
MHVLIVDPDADDVELFCEALLTINPEIGCVFSKNGREAWEMLQSAREAPAIIFSEIDMPELNGFKFIECIKRHQFLKNIPIIVYTAATHYFISRKPEPIKEKCLELGVSQLLKKPTTFEQIVEAVRLCLESYKVKNN